MIAAALFDVDGTLVDSNGAHREAWQRAFTAHELSVEPAELAAAIGQGGDKLVPALVGHAVEAALGDELRAHHDREFEAIAGRGLSAMPGAVALLVALRDRGMPLAIATSSGGGGLAACERATGVGWRGLVDVVTNADKVRASKPDPDLISVAVRELGAEPGACVMIGDTRWDAISAARAGVGFVGVTCGGSSREALAGARAIYANPAAILRDLDRLLT